MKIKNLFLLFIIFLAYQCYPKTCFFFSFDFDDAGNPVCSNLSKSLESMILEAKEQVLIAIYAFTSAKIANALILAKTKNPNLVIEIVLDKFSTIYWGKAKLVADHGIPVFVFDHKKFLKKLGKKEIPESKYSVFSESIMHNKYAIIDNKVWYGSYNFTQRADKANLEFVGISSGTKKVDLFKRNFFHLKKHCSTFEIFIQETKLPDIGNELIVKKSRNKNEKKQVKKRNFFQKVASSCLQGIEKIYKKILTFYT